MLLAKPLAALGCQNAFEGDRAFIYASTTTNKHPDQRTQEESRKGQL